MVCVVDSFSNSGDSEMLIPAARATSRLNAGIQYRACSPLVRKISKIRSLIEHPKRKAVSQKNPRNPLLVIYLFLFPIYIISAIIATSISSSRYCFFGGVSKSWYSFSTVTEATLLPAREGRPGTTSARGGRGDVPAACKASSSALFVQRRLDERDDHLGEPGPLAPKGGLVLLVRKALPAADAVEHPVVVDQ